MLFGMPHFTPIVGFSNVSASAKPQHQEPLRDNEPLHYLISMRFMKDLNTLGPVELDYPHMVVTPSLLYLF
jgi:hypothetical protein